MITSTETTTSSVLAGFLPYYLPALLYLSVELCFGVLFFAYMIPRANRLTEPIPYRDYGEDKRKLMLRIMHRIEEVCSITKADKKQTMKTFLTEWFHIDKTTRRTTSKDGTTATVVVKCETPEITYSPSSSPDNSDDESSEAHTTKNAASRSDSTKTTVVATVSEIKLFRQEMDRFFAWAFYGKFHSNLQSNELHELDRIYQELEDRHDLVFPVRTTSHEDGHHVQYGQPRCMTLERVNAMYRPLLVYLLVYSIKIAGGIFLRIMGFRRMVASTGLVAWYRPGKNSCKNKGATKEVKEDSSTYLPLLFFHGIAPGGVNLYLPMLFYGLATEPERSVFLFENRSISCAIDFEPLTEQKTVDGVVELLKVCGGIDQKDLSLVGHSFGSCLITWLLASKKLPNVKQVVLLDPVSVLLSEPDVMVNFLYAEELDKIRMVASSELFTEYYLRRHFAWYNSELWLEDVDCPMLIGLSEKDEIINSKKVKQEVERHAKSAKLVYWEGVGHGACIQSPAKWRQLKQLMLEQELQILQRQSDRQ
jgi:pimeloyl-ACP methyl ester carboxylesterase